MTIKLITPNKEFNAVENHGISYSPHSPHILKQGQLVRRRICPMQKYRLIHTLAALQEYLAAATLVAFDFETAPLDKYRREDKAALDAHKSHIVGVSFSVAEGDAVYLPLAHLIGENAADFEGIWDYLAGFFVDPNICKIAHNLAFESQFLYARGIVIQEPCYDTIAAAQLSYKAPYLFA